MILYLDETENTQYFIVAGLMVSSQEVINNSFKKFKKSIKNLPLQNKYKSIVFSEFKSYILDRSYKTIKFRMLNELNCLDYFVLFSYYKKETIFKQSLKQKIYLQLVENIISKLDFEFDIVFDNFGIDSFEKTIVEKFSKKHNIKTIKPLNSQQEPGLKYIDNLCSVIRLHISNEDKYGFYDLIKDKVIEI